MNTPWLLFAIRWGARLLSIGAIAFFALALGDGWPPKSTGEWAAMAFFPGGVTVGMLIGWRRELIGGLVTVASLAGFYGAMWWYSGSIPTTLWFLVFALPGFLFLFCALIDTSRQLDQLQRNTLFGLATGLVLATAKFIAGVLGHSSALVADAVESLADSVGSLIVWRGLAVSDRPADPDHPYGYGKAEAVAAFCVGGLLVASCVVIAVGAVAKVLTPHEPPAAWTLVVLVVVIVIKETLAQRILRDGDRLGSSAARADAWHHRADAITSFAALIGVSVAVWGPSLFESPRLVLADEVAALIASGIILYTGLRLAREALRELLDAAAPELAERVATTAATVAGVRLIEKVYARRSGRRAHIDMHLHVDPALSVRDAHALAGLVRATVCARHPDVRDVLIHVEPAVGESD